MFWQRTGGEGDLLSNLTENTFSLRAMKGVGV